MNYWKTDAPMTDEVHRDLKRKSPALELASRSALEAIAFGLSVDDLYLLAWELCSAEGTPLRKTLDRYFNRADRGDE